MKFYLKQNQVAVFVGERLIPSKDPEKKPFPVIKIADPLTYDSLEFFKSREYVGDNPAPGDHVSLELDVTQGKFLNVNIFSMKIQK